MIPQEFPDFKYDVLFKTSLSGKTLFTRKGRIPRYNEQFVHNEITYYVKDWYMGKLTMDENIEIIILLNQ